MGKKYKRLILQRCTNEFSSKFNLFTVGAKAKTAKYDSDPCSIQVDTLMNDLGDAISILDEIQTDHVNRNLDIHKTEFNYIAKKVLKPLMK